MVLIMLIMLLQYVSIERPRVASFIPKPMIAMSGEYPLRSPFTNCVASPDKCQVCVDFDGADEGAINAAISSAGVEVLG